jgi:hypothetical protein
MKWKKGYKDKNKKIHQRDLRSKEKIKENRLDVFTVVFAVVRISF